MSLTSYELAFTLPIDSSMIVYNISTEQVKVHKQTDLNRLDGNCMVADEESDNYSTGFLPFCLC